MTIDIHIIAEIWRSLFTQRQEQVAERECRAQDKT
jgi:hypothetical protein